MKRVSIGKEESEGGSLLTRGDVTGPVDPAYETNHGAIDMMSSGVEASGIDDSDSSVGAATAEQYDNGPALDVVDVLKEAGAGEPSAETFGRIATAVFQNPDGISILKHHLGDWRDLEAAHASKNVSTIIRGYCHYILGDMANAEKALSKEKRSDWGGYYYVRTLVSRHRKEAAYKAAEVAAEENPDSVDLGFLRVETHCKIGREEDAGKILEGYAAEYENDTRYQYHLGLWNERSSNYQEAIECFRKAVELDSANSSAWFRLGFCLDLYGKGDEEAIDDAIAAYENCLRQSFPPPTNAVINLGILYEDRERYHDAIKCFESVLSFNPNHQRARLFLDDAIASTRMFYDKEEEKKADRHSQVLKIPVTDFELSVRSRNCLSKMNIITLGDLIMKSEQELLSYKNFGETSLKEIKDMLGQKGLRLGQGLEKPGSHLDEPRNPLESTADPSVLDRSIDSLELSVRSRRCMERLGITSIRDLINRTEVQLMAAKNFGMTSLNEIKRKMAELGLKLRG